MIWWYGNFQGTPMNLRESFLPLTLSSCRQCYSDEMGWLERDRPGKFDQKRPPTFDPSRPRVKQRLSILQILGGASRFRGHPHSYPSASTAMAQHCSAHSNWQLSLSFSYHTGRYLAPWLQPRSTYTNPMPFNLQIKILRNQLLP